MERRASNRERYAGASPAVSEGTKKVLGVFEALQADPFQGAVERRVIDDDMRASDMEEIAAKQALEKAGIDRAHVGLLICHSAVPDYLVTNNACLLHERLGLSRECFTMANEAACNSFLMQLAIAEKMLAGGVARYALLVQSCAISRIIDPNEPLSPNFGDGASAVVVGPVAAGRGVIASAFRTDGSLHRAVVGGVRGRSWYDDGRVAMYSEDPSAARQTFMEIADKGDEVTGAVLRDAGCKPADIGFFGVHQGTSWARRLLTEHFGLTSARSVETYAWAASIFAANIPLGLAIGEKEGLLRQDDLVLTFAGGAGLSYGSVLLRWGR
jgi:3-oxoacyl-[acyl-carrier-protein] synthase-3